MLKGRFMGSMMPPWNAHGMWICKRTRKPAAAVAIKVDLRFPEAARRWIGKHKVCTLHVTGTAPYRLAVRYLREVLTGRKAKR